MATAEGTPYQRMAAKRLRQKGLVNEARHVQAANRKTPFDLPGAEKGGGVQYVPNTYGTTANRLKGK